MEKEILYIIKEIQTACTNPLSASEFISSTISLFSMFSSERQNERIVYYPKVPISEKIESINRLRELYINDIIESKIDFTTDSTLQHTIDAEPIYIYIDLFRPEQNIEENSKDLLITIAIHFICRFIFQMSILDHCFVTELPTEYIKIQSFYIEFVGPRTLRVYYRTDADLTNLKKIIEQYQLMLNNHTYKT